MIKNDLSKTELKTSDFNFDLPQELIAQHPCEPRDAARLLVMDRETQTLEHRIFRDITEYLRRRRPCYKRFEGHSCKNIR